MEYIVLLDYTDGEVIKIRFSEQEASLADKSEDFEEFLRTLEEKYHFRLVNCCWMSTSNLKERCYFIILTYTISECFSDNQ
jgi:uncharacterized alpha/beta hydrolase family protein